MKPVPVQTVPAGSDGCGVVVGGRVVGVGGWVVSSDFDGAVVVVVGFVVCGV